MVRACRWTEEQPIVETLMLDANIRHTQRSSHEEWHNLLIECHTTYVSTRTQKRFRCNLCTGAKADKLYQKQHINKHRLTYHRVPVLYPKILTKNFLNEFNPKGTPIQEEALQAFMRKIMLVKTSPKRETAYTSKPSRLSKHTRIQSAGKKVESSSVRPSSAEGNPRC